MERGRPEEPLPAGQEEPQPRSPGRVKQERDGERGAEPETPIRAAAPAVQEQRPGTGTGTTQIDRRTPMPAREVAAVSRTSRTCGRGVLQ